MRKIKKQAGFTLIELIMVIVILGVLSAFALPRFADLGGQARAATINGVAGSLKAASNIAHAQWLAIGTSPASVTLEGTVIAMSNGYPTAASILLAAQVTADDFDSSASGTTVTVTAKGATTAANCSVAYTEATATAAASVGTPTTTGC